MMENTPLIKEENKQNPRETIFFIITLCVFIVIFLLTNVFFSVVMVSGDSMLDTLYDGNVLVVSRLVEPNYGDVIVFEGDNGKIIKRVIAKEGDSIYSDGTNVYLKKQGESEFTMLEETYVKSATLAFNEVTVPENGYFVLGDNRAISNDSRYFGAVDKESVLGVVKQSVIDNTNVYTKLFGWIFNL
ncbi:MAG: signal peptidase I [Clostridia bacterium]|nr:signal peptidase I [Clostridia bacterium]